MNKNKLEERAKYVQKRVDKVNNKPTEIKRLADELFLSEKTIRKDLGKLRADEVDKSI